MNNRRNINSIRNTDRANTRRSDRKDKVFLGIALGGLGILSVVLGLVALVATVAWIALIVFMFIWNITDVQNVGFNFWNVFWLILASIFALSTLGSLLRGGTR